MWIVPPNENSVWINYPVNLQHVNYFKKTFMNGEYYIEFYFHTGRAVNWMFSTEHLRDCIHSGITSRMEWL